MLIRELFSRGYTKIVLDTNLKNKRAQHVYERLGFQKVDVRIDAWIDQVGEKQSVVDYELTKEHFVDFVLMDEISHVRKAEQSLNSCSHRNVHFLSIWKNGRMMISMICTITTVCHISR